MKLVRLLPFTLLLLLLAACVDPPAAQNIAPKAVITTDTPEGDVTVGTTVTLDSTLSDDPDGRISKRTWFLNGQQYSTDVTTTIPLDNVGAHTIELEVTDNRGLTGKDSVTYNVIPLPDEATPTPTGAMQIHDINAESEDIRIFLGYEERITIEVYEAWELRADAPWLSFEPSSGPAPEEAADGNVDPFVHPALVIDQTLMRDTGEEEVVTVTLSALDPESDSEDTASFTLVIPRLTDLTTGPTEFRKSVGRSARTIIEVRNASEEALLNLHLSAGEDLAPLLSFEPLHEDIGAGSTHEVGVAVNCATETPEDGITGAITIASNDPTAGDQSVPITVTCLTAEESDFKIDIRFVNDADWAGDYEDHQKLFDSAADRWREVILAGEPPAVNTDVIADVCDIEGLELEAGVIDGIVIFVDVRDLTPVPGDGGDPYSANESATAPAANAKPCAIRGPTGNPWGLPFVGNINFDQNYLAVAAADAQFEDVIIHEMGHALGLGTMWGYAGFTPDTCDVKGEIPPIEYSGANATHWFNELGGIGKPIVDYKGPEGTRCGHWDGQTFDNEIMSGVISHLGAPISKVTIGALEDLGYTVDYTLADAYKLPTDDEVAPTSIRMLNLSGDTIR